MKIILLLLLLFPNISNGQTEISEKLSKVFGSKPNTTQQSESSQKIVKLDEFHYQKKQNFNTQQTPFERITYYDHYRYNWYTWGAPYSGYINYTPLFYYDRFGLRQPSRIYNMSDGSKKVVEGKKTNYRLGLGYGYKNNLSFWGSAGRRTFFIAEVSTIVQVDRSSFMPNVRMDEVLKWNDRQLEDLNSGNILYLGVGTKFSKLGGYLMCGYGYEIHNLQFFDELFILSNNGRYSIRNYDESFFTGKIGLIYDHKFVSFKTDYNPFRNNLNIGLGISF